MQFNEKIIVDKKFIYAWFQAMYTRIDLLFYAKLHDVDLVSVSEEIEAEILRIEKFSNRFDDDSELSKVNRLAFIQDVEISAELYSIVSDCIAYSKQSLGYFDVTINSLNDYKQGIDGILLCYENRTMRFSHADIKIDLSGFIKGYALRKVIEILSVRGIENALVNIGNSSVYAKGNHFNGEGWLVNIPGINRDYLLKNKCLTTSGNSEKTKWPVTNPMSRLKGTKAMAVSVITDDPAEGEVLSKVLYLSDNDDIDELKNRFIFKIID